MTAPLLLRVAAALALLQGIGHGILFLRAAPTHGPAEEAVVGAMRANRFAFSAAPRSYWEMYSGYGIEAIAVCLLEAAILWLTAGAAGTTPLARQVAALFLAWNVGHALLVWRYFAFPVPIVFDGAIAVALGAALLA